MRERAAWMSRVIDFATPWLRSFSTPMLTLLPSRISWGMVRLRQPSGYCRVANLKVQRNYYKAMQIVLQRTQAQEKDDKDEESMNLHG
jgi:hypothetical protein